MFFGGEDQREEMAHANQAAKSEAKKEVKKVVKELVKDVAKEAKKDAQRRSAPNRRWKGQRGKQTKQTVHKEANKKLRKEGLEGPRPRFSVRVSATIGKVGPNKEQGPELQIATFLHPGLMKEPNDGTNFGPLQPPAAQWGMWRIASLSVRFTPLVGPSPVTGSVYRVSLNLTQSPGNSSWGGLGARRHMDIPVGRQVTWKLTKGELYRPRQTWWMTDTNEEGGQSCGAIIEVHGLGKTTSTYKDEPWIGDLFIVEVDGKWEFTNYSAKPALGMLDRKTEELTASGKQAGLQVTDGVLEMTLPKDSELARFMSDGFERNAPQAGTVGETIWQVVDEGAGLAADLAPVPFTWLIKGAWWFVKKIAGRGSNATETYQVYASLADAQNGKPAQAEPFVHATRPTTLTITQVNAPNVGPADTRTAFHSGVSPYPLVPVEAPPPPGSTVVLMARFAPIAYIKYPNSQLEQSVVKAHVKKNSTEYFFSLKRGQTKSYASAAYLVMDPSLISVDGTRITGCYDPGWLDHTGITAHYRNTDAFGQVVAYAVDEWANSGQKFTAAAWLVRVTRTLEQHTFTDMWPWAPNAYIAGRSSVTPPIQYTLDKANVPFATKPDGATHLNASVSQPQILSGTLLLLYSIGQNTKSRIAGFTDGEPLVNSTNDAVLAVDKEFNSGLWAMCLSPIGPKSDYGSMKFVLPTRSDDKLEELLDLIQLRFNLKPTVESESDETDEDSQDESEVEDCTDAPTPPEPTPRLKLAKEMMYEALRDADWTHVDADALLAAISTKN
ncbi:capsid protein [Mamastrovirus 11]|uniref:Capsid protein n=1 Tax=Mamastrovirus 11 TaxID=1239575 RepID=C5IDP2_9VIRU|nr:capsid protein [Mamastrovirus 11]ACR54272.1 capsid protein [Mamastrovirus 11]